MRKLKHVRYTHSRKLTEEQKDEMLIPEVYDGCIAIETWEVNGELRENFVRIKGITNYILGLGPFKEDVKENSI